MTTRKRSRTLTLVALTMAILVITTTSATQADTTLKPGGEIRTAADWSNGLPSAGNPGTVAVDGILTATTFGYGADAVINHTAGSIVASGTNGFNMNGGGTWNMSGGSITARYILSNTANTIFNFSGGTAILSDVTGNQHTGVANSGTLNISGSAVIDATQATMVLQTGGTINIASDWTGSWTYGFNSGTDWRDLFTTNSAMKVDGVNIDGPTFDALFQITDDGKTLSMITDKTKAHDPMPKTDEVDVPRDAGLSWGPGEAAATHDVYFGKTFDSVNSATTSSAEYRGRQPATAFAPGRLDFGQTYYWRIDEVSTPPASTISKGDVWSFAVELFAYPIDANNITATASNSNSATEGPENTINSSGLDANGLHSAANTDMWLSSLTGPQPTWIQYEFDSVHKLHQMWVWNHNTLIETAIGFGIKEATIEYSADGANWNTLGTTHEFARAPGAAGYAPSSTIDFGGVAAKYVKITPNSNWGSILSQYGLSEVRFFYIPASAREPSPASGATDVSVDTTLSWRAGREAARHDVYLSTNEQAVIDGTIPAVTVTEPSYAVALDLGSTYYWRIDEVNEAETPSTWQGDVWSLSTQEYLTVDDFESYNDTPAGEEGSKLVYETWVDGFGTTTNGSTIGYTEAFQPSMEKTIVFDGKQSVPLFYNNTAAARSEVTANVANLQAGKDWSKYGIKGLTPRFYGDPNNVAQQMYVKVNGVKVMYDGDAQGLRLKGWQMWYIDLASLGGNLSNVTTLTIGFERIGTVGGQGMVLFDGFRLYSYERQLITPADPGTTGLQAQYQFEGNAKDSSGNNRNGTLQGGPLFVAGKIGQAVKLDGTKDFVQIDSSFELPVYSIALWFRIDGGTGNRDLLSMYNSTGGHGIILELTSANQLRYLHRFPFGTSGGNNIYSGTYDVGGWHHVAIAKSAEAMTLYVDGLSVDTLSDSTQFDQALTMVMGVLMHSNLTRFLPGAIDEVRIYDRALSPEEVAGLAGLTVPFDKPF